VDSGYVKIYRKTRLNGTLKDIAEVGAWVDLIMHATWKPHGGLGRGEVAASTRYLAARYRWTHKRTRCWLGRLAKAEMISRPRDGVVRITNYDHYQADEGHTKGHTQGHGQGHTAAQAGSDTQPERGTPRGTPKGTPRGTKTRRDHKKGVQDNSSAAGRPRRSTFEKSAKGRLLLRFGDAHLALCGGVKYKAVFGRDQKILGDLEGVHGEPLVAEMIQAFYDSQRWSRDADRKDTSGDPRWAVAACGLDVPGFARSVRHLTKAFSFDNASKGD